MKNTKIIATLGPSTLNESFLRDAIRAGVNVFRLNFSHGDHEWHGNAITMIQNMRQELGMSVLIMMDTKGPGVRVLESSDALKILKGQLYMFTDDQTKKVSTPGTTILLDYPSIAKDASRGKQITLDNGMLVFDVEKIKGSEVYARAVCDGVLTNKRHLNLPYQKISLPTLTPKDIDDISFTVSKGVDIVSVSFCRSALDIENARAIARGLGRSVAIVAKIENVEGVDQREEIIQSADGVMIARGDLGVELAEARVPVLQREIIRLCRVHATPVITATEMLLSMTENPRPTRAEVSDVAHAVWDGTDAIMLSNETASGRYPLEAVQTMADIAEEVEPCRTYYDSAIKDTWEKSVVNYRQYSDEYVKQYDAVLVHGDVTLAILLSTLRLPRPIFFIPDDTSQVTSAMGLFSGVIPVSNVDMIEHYVGKDASSGNHTEPALLHVYKERALIS